MAKQTINVGSVANDKSGDPLRTAFTKINSNFNELYSLVGSTELTQDYVAPALTHNGHTGITFSYDDANNRLIAVVSTQFPNQTNNSGKFLKTNGSSVSWDYVPYSSLTDVPVYSTVASTGSYNDLSNKPIIPNTGNITFSNSNISTSVLGGSINVSGGGDSGAIGGSIILSGGSGPTPGKIVLNSGTTAFGDKSIEFSDGDLTAPAGSDINLKTRNNGAGDAGDIVLTAGTGSVNNGEVWIRTGSTPYEWHFDNGGILTVPGRITLGTDAFIVGNGDFAGLYPSSTSSSAGLEIDAVNDALLVGTRNVIIRANGDSPWKSWTFDNDGNLTIPGEIHGKQLIGVGGVANGRVVNITPANDASDKKFGFRVDQFGETFTRAYLDMPEAQNNKQVAISFPHANSTVGYIFTQGANTSDDGLNNAFNIFYNAGDIKLTAMTPGTGAFKTWKFGTDGKLGVPGAIANTAGPLELSGRVALPGRTNRSVFWDGDSIYSQNNQVSFRTSSGIGMLIDGGNSPNSIDLGNNSSGDRVRLLWGAGTVTGNNLDIEFKGFGSAISITPNNTSGGSFKFNSNGSVTFPDASVQTSAFVGNADTINITNTNGLTTTYYPTFVENRDGGETLRADVDLTYRTDTNTLTAGNVTTGILKIEDGVHEKFQAKADATGVVAHDCASGHVFYHTSPDADWTVNLTNLNLSSGYATAVTLVIVQGGTGYYPSAVQIGGVAQTLNWQGNATPTPSTNRTDVVTFSIINNSGTYTVLGQLTGF